MGEGMFETARLSVRHFRPTDLDAFASLCADPEVMRFVGDGTTLSREEVAHWIEVCRGKYRDRGYGTSAVLEKASGEFLGYCGVVRAPDQKFDELIYVFHQKAWGKGYATEAGRAMLDHVFARTSLERIWATIHQDNADSVRVVEKLGFSFQRRELEADGSYTAYYARNRTQPS